MDFWLVSELTADEFLLCLEHGGVYSKDKDITKVFLHLEFEVILASVFIHENAVPSDLIVPASVHFYALKFVLLFLNLDLWSYQL